MTLAYTSQTQLLEIAVLDFRRSATCVMVNGDWRWGMTCHWIRDKATLGLKFFRDIAFRTRLLVILAASEAVERAWTADNSVLRQALKPRNVLDWLQLGRNAMVGIGGGWIPSKLCYDSCNENHQQREACVAGRLFSEGLIIANSHERLLDWYGQRNFSETHPLIEKLRHHRLNRVETYCPAKLTNYAVSRMITAATEHVSKYYLSISTASIAHARNWDAKLPTTDHESQCWLVSVRYTRYLCPCKILRRISGFWTLPNYVPWWTRTLRGTRSQKTPDPHRLATGSSIFRWKSKVRVERYLLECLQRETREETHGPAPAPVSPDSRRIGAFPGGPFEPFSLLVLTVVDDDPS
ncbi:hypothetical protein IMY05_C4680000100 [Salix suchowensis]|nr:hypothetical protein IMY05_C4680000100 [Salix suchowensis]